MTPALILNKLDLDLAPAGLLVALGLVSVIFVVVASALSCFVVLDERVVARYGLAGAGVDGIEPLPLVARGRGSSVLRHCGWVWDVERGRVTGAVSTVLVRVWVVLRNRRVGERVWGRRGGRGCTIEAAGELSEGG